uniref:Uncharacterized protein n=1 Tax=Anguilla anguilla TaxID=7936 RepID=A0A0E9QRV9_ANGAN
MITCYYCSYYYHIIIIIAVLAVVQVKNTVIIINISDGVTAVAVLLDTAVLIRVMKVDFP